MAQQEGRDQDNYLIPASVKGVASGLGQLTTNAFAPLHNGPRQAPPLPNPGLQANFKSSRCLAQPPKS